jgi:arsenate reductase-like glutaredoxin family protein
LKPQQALQRLLGRAEEIYVCKGKQAVTVSLKKEKVPAEDLQRLLAGPTGNLRAPTALVGKKVLVGFDEATCRQLFGV